MKQVGDKVQFESRAELGKIIRVLERYMDDYPAEKDNMVVKRLYNIVGAIEMYW